MPPLPDIDSLSTLGGILTNASPVVDPTTDLDADADTKSRANVAMMTHMIPRAMRSWIGGTTPSDPVIALVHDAVWGGANAVKPTVTWSSTGIYNVFFPVSVNDEIGIAHTLVLRAGIAQIAGGAAAYIIQSERLTSTNGWRVRIFNFVGGVPTLNDANGATITLWVW